MFDKLIDILSIIWKDIWIFCIVRENEEGIRLRYGKLNKTVLPGIVFKIPFIDEVIIKYTKDDTILLPSQKLTTKDGKTITITGMVLYKVDNITEYILAVNLPQQSISDVAMGALTETIIERTYAEVLESIEKLGNEVSKRVRRECKKWGVVIEYVKITDITVSKSLNLFKNSEAHL